MKNYDISFYQLFDDVIDNTDGNIFVTTDYYGNKVIENKLSRYHVGDLMKRNCTDLVITDKDLETFNSEFTYLFDGFTAFSDSDTPLTDCIRQFNQARRTCGIWREPGHQRLGRGSTAHAGRCKMAPLYPIRHGIWRAWCRRDDSSLQRIGV